MPPQDENDLPGTPWDIHVDQRIKENNLTQNQARDVVIIEWLRKGDTTPFTAFVSAGHTPSIDIIKYVALMMNPPEGTDKLVPFSLKTSPRGRKGRPPDPVIEARGKLSAQYVERLMKEGKSYDKAIDIVTQIIVDDQIDKYVDASPRDTVEKDYKRYKSKP